MDLSILQSCRKFREHVIRTLGEISSDYPEQLRFVESHRKTPTPWNAAGVLLPLIFRGGMGAKGEESGEFVFFLNKRSKQVQQAGDLCAPGGGIHPLMDGIFQRLLSFGFPPFGRGAGIEEAKKKGREAFSKILLFFGNALRESWEEIGLAPFNVELLGVLPTYRLQSRRWILFPLVGRIKRPWKPRLSWEVEKIVSIPLGSFYQAENYAIYSLRIPEKLRGKGIPDPWQFPCLVYPSEGKEEILWGATFHVIRSFLEIIFPDPLPFPDGQRIVEKTLPPNYFSGGKEP